MAGFGQMTPRKAAEFAKLYVHGPKHLRGDFSAVAAYLRLVPPPARNDPMLRRAIEAEGGIAPALAALPAPDYETVTDDNVDDTILEAEYVAQNVGKDSNPWKAVAERLRNIMEEIASTGYVGASKASAAQVAAIKEIFARAEGRVAERQNQLAAPAGVVVLPGDANEFTCPKCGYRSE